MGERSPSIAPPARERAGGGLVQGAGGWPAVLAVSASLGGLSLVAIAGAYVWDRYTVSSLSTLTFDSPGALLILGFLAGAGAFFAPCAISLSRAMSRTTSGWRGPSAQGSCRGGGGRSASG